jgi:hypothetical protein
MERQFSETAIAKKAQGRKYIYKKKVAEVRQWDESKKRVFGLLMGTCAVIAAFQTATPIPAAAAKPPVKSHPQSHSTNTSLSSTSYNISSPAYNKLYSYEIIKLEELEFKSHTQHHHNDPKKSGISTDFSLIDGPKTLVAGLPKHQYHNYLKKLLPPEVIAYCNRYPNDAKHKIINLYLDGLSDHAHDRGMIDVLETYCKVHISDNIFNNEVICFDSSWFNAFSNAIQDIQNELADE